MLKKWLLLLIGLIGASLFVAACVTTPVTKRKALVIVPDSQMNALGSQAYRDMLKKEKRSTNRVLTRKVEEIGRRIANASGAKFKWEFALIENSAVNAFCLPGGKIGIYTGILPIAKNNAGLAAIMGHEVAHATARHGAERVSQSLLVGGTMIGLGVAMKDVKHRQTIMAAIGLGVTFGVLMPYGRSHESEADSIGLTYMAKAGYDPKEAPLLWERMAKKGGGRVPELLSTHPDPKRRASDLRKQQAKVAGMYSMSQKQKTADL